MVSAGALALLGCNSADPESDAPEPEPSSDQTDLEEPEADLDEETAQAEPEPSETDADADQLEFGGSGFVMGALVDSFPASITLPPDAQVISSYEPSWEDSGQWGVATLTGLDRDALRDLYTNAFTSDGWQLDDVQDTEFFLMMEASGPEYTVNMISSEEDGLTRVDMIIRHAS